MLRLGSILPVSPLRRIAGAALARRVRRPVPAGESLKLIGSVAVGDDFIGTAYAAFRTAAHRGVTGGGAHGVVLTGGGGKHRAIPRNARAFGVGEKPVVDQSTAEQPV